MIDIPDSILLKDENGNVICPCCKKLEKDCTCMSIEESKNQEQVATLITQKCKKGKIVTLIKNLRPEKEFLKALTRECKTHLGTGGDFSIEEGEGIITLQGNKMEAAKSILKKKGISSK